MKNKNIVTLGGGTGSFSLLSGLNKYPINISAIVSMADDGGSTGVLRDELGVLPPGDVRQCLVALSDSSEILRELMNYRFEEGGLKGHSFGNLFLSALERIKGNFVDGVKEASKILNIKGEVIPVISTSSHLFLELNNGTVIQGEEQINHNFNIQSQGIKKIYLSPHAKANKEAIKAIQNADLIVVGPGNHYCSVVPIFLAHGIPEAIRTSKAKVVLNCNLVNKKGHTENFTLDDYVDSINGYIGNKRIDFVIFNTKKPLEKLVKRYEDKKELLVTFDIDARNKRKYQVIRANVLSDKKIKHNNADVLAHQRAFIRHDSEKLAKILMMILEIGEYKNIIKEII